MKNKYTIMKPKQKKFFELIPQTGVTHLHVTEDPQHNAVWDMAISPEGRVFFSACGESYLPLYARLYEYDKKEKKLVRHFALEEKILMHKGSLRTSKLHTAMSFMGDGWMLSATHTTSPAPSHPTWMPYEYAEHPYEGYQGSSLFMYNYETGEFRGLGTMSPRDTVYGATYDPKNGDYFGITWMRGTGYVYNVHTGECRCLGQVSDSHTSRTFLCSNGHIYGSTYSGAIFRYNTDIRDIEFLGVDAPGLIRHAVEHEGILYFTTGPCSVPGRGQELYAFDLTTHKITTVGRPVPKAESINDDPYAFYNAYGMAMDNEGVLWYGCMTFVPTHKYVGARLFKWDFLHGGEPIDCGFLGTPERTLSITAEMYIRDDVIYISDGNHTSHVDTPCGIIVIDLEKFRPALKSEERLMSHDYVNYLPYQEEALDWYPKNDLDKCLALYDEYFENTVKYFGRFVKENNAKANFAKVSGVSVWERIGRGCPAKSIKWTSNDSLELVFGDERNSLVSVSLDDDGNARVTDIREIEAGNYSALCADIPEVSLPSVPGRKYLAEAESSITLADGRVLIGTRDGMLALIDGERVFSLGQITTAGGVHSLSRSTDGRVWGVAGHAEGCGTIFTYSDECGITLLGITPEAFAENRRNVCIYRPTVISVSPDGHYVAVAGDDEIGGAVIFTAY